ncbi:hypothetical protein CHS0354_001768 [Potamilus streckersoni]|uniref:Uncharacterized protein n=1 Tax=Potamilus streckersoni TaxID=2493646 RepID=A0AAE0SJG8_9BIVA|nr:hypothetical protein CHS0354_001768 [Potamilus streckersoni]
MATQICLLVTLCMLIVTGSYGMDNTRQCMALNGYCADARLIRCPHINYDACDSLGIKYAVCCYNPVDPK